MFLRPWYDHQIPTTSEPEASTAMRGQETRSLQQIDPLTELLYWEQTGNVQDYFDSFNLLLSRVNISENLATEIFLRGLEPGIQRCVRCFEPRDVKSAYYLARLKESTISVIGVKEDVIVNGIGAGTCGATVLEFVEEHENEDVSRVFDEMSVKEMDSVLNANILPEPEWCLFDKPMEILSEELSREGEEWSSSKALDAPMLECEDLSREPAQSVRNRTYRYPSLQKCNLRLGESKNKLQIGLEEVGRIEHEDNEGCSLVYVYWKKYMEDVRITAKVYENVVPAVIYSASMWLDYYGIARSKYEDPYLIRRHLETVMAYVSGAPIEATLDISDQLKGGRGSLLGEGKGFAGVPPTAMTSACTCDLIIRRTSEGRGR